MQLERNAQPKENFGVKQNMGKSNKKHVAHDFKQKHPKNKGTKSYIAFDEQARAEFLTGFRKRKNERRKKAQEEIIQKLKEQKKRIREKKKARLHEELPADLDWKDIAPSETYNLASHTVTVTDVTDVDFVGSGGFMLGSNTHTKTLIEERVPASAEDGKTSDAEDKEKPVSKTKARKTKLQEQKLRTKLNLKGKRKRRHRRKDTKKRKRTK